MKGEVIERDKSVRATTGSGMIPDLGSWMSGYSHVLESWAQSSTDMMKGATEISQEIITFSQGRFQGDMEAWKTLASCRNPGELFERQAELATKATTAYLDEVNKLASRAIALMSDATAPFRQEQASK